ncbi:MAG: glycosyltransferase family 2 protein [Bacteroidetes bacterium]|nr:glycosyltransferase family 2 protein [Bacteroidota bacterium]
MEKVSIILPTFNRAHLLEETIKSIQWQTHPHWELIIVDDGSTDGTPQLIEQLSDNRIRYFAQRHSGNIVSTRLNGVHYANGEFIAFLDSDDLWIPEKLKTQMDLLHEHPDASFVFSNGFHFGEDDSLPKNCIPFFKGNIFLPMLMDEQFIYFVPSLIIRKKVMNQVTALMPHPIENDLDFLLRLGCVCDGIFINKRLVKIRKHHDSDSNNHGIRPQMEYISMVGRFKDMNMLAETDFNEVTSRELYKLGLKFARNKNWVIAEQYFNQALNASPYSLRILGRLIQVKLNKVIQHR